MAGASSGEPRHNAVWRAARASFRAPEIFQSGSTFVEAFIPLGTDGHACRPGCGACCIAPSITSPIPGMPNGKPAGVRCVQLDDDFRCKIFGRPERPACCGGLQPQAQMCGASRGEALAWLAWLEALTQPGGA